MTNQAQSIETRQALTNHIEQLKQERDELRQKLRYIEASIQRAEYDLTQQPVNDKPL